MAGQSKPRELPPCIRGEEIPIRPAKVVPRRRTRPAPQDKLIAHEFAVVFSQRSRCGLIAGIPEVRAGGPFPHVAEHLRKAWLLRECEAPAEPFFAPRKMRLGRLRRAQSSRSLALPRLRQVSRLRQTFRRRVNPRCWRCLTKLFPLRVGLQQIVLRFHVLRTTHKTSTSGSDSRCNWPST